MILICVVCVLRVRVWMFFVLVCLLIGLVFLFLW